MKIVWFCKYCNDVIISDNEIRHNLNKCKCERSMVDLEEEYCRVAGAIEILAEYNRGKWVRKRK